MQRQLSYIRHVALGYDRDHVIELPMNGRLLDRMDLIRSELLANPDILSLSHCNESPVSINGGYDMRSAVMPSSRTLAVNGDPIDPGFLPTVGLRLLAGTNITEQDMRDAQAAQRVYHYILNESAARQLGWTPQEAIGKRMFMDDSRPGVVKGVVQDFHFQSLHQAIRPLILFPEMRGRRLLVRVTGQRLPETIAFLSSKWRSLVPEIPFEYHFLDEDYNKLYDSENRLGEVMNLFSAIAIVLACLGLFGLSSYSAKQRVKEIGIRKVLGAPTAGLVMLMAGGFMRLAVVAMVIAMPLAGWAMHGWLQDFVYRTGMAWWVFVLAGVVVIAVTLGTVSIQAVRTALVNPVRSLRTE
jgi:putative ABC transport system permease protein